MPTDLDTRAAGSRSLRRTVAASVIGTIAEYYDFFIYGTASALVFNKVFFPDSDPGDPFAGVMVINDPIGDGAAIRAAIDTINQLLFKRLSELILAQPELEPASTRTTWLLLDEVRQAGKLDGLSALMTKGRSKGAAVLLVSSEIEEVLELSSRIFLLHAGRILEELDPNRLTSNELSRHLVSPESLRG